MNDYAYVSSSEVRKNFSETINSALYVKPQLIKRNKNVIMLLSKELVFGMLENYHINITVKKDRNTFFTVNDVMEDIIGWGDSKQEAIDDFINSLDVYAHDYYDNFQVYSKTARGKKDLPYVLRIISASELDDIKSMIICQDGKN